MKKILTVLIIAMVAFSLFAETTGTIAGNTGQTTLTLEASQGGKLYHGFTNTNHDSSSAIVTALSGDATGSYTFGTHLDLEEGTDPQSIGYYHLYTTGNNQVKVTFVVSPLHLEVGGLHYYVPYQLAYTKTSGSQDVTAGTVGTAPGAPTISEAVVTGNTASGDIITTTNNGLRWATLSLTALFNGDSNADLPESTGEGGTGDYTGTVVANILVL